MADMQTRIELYKTYLAELDAIAERSPAPKGAAEDTAKTYLQASHADWIDILSPDNKAIGFLIICTDPDCHPLADYFIAQTYVKPEYRRNGCAKAAVLGYVKTHPGVYCKIMIEKNKGAFAFWNKIKTECHAEPVDLIDIPGVCDPGEIQIGFLPHI